MPNNVISRLIIIALALLGIGCGGGFGGRTERPEGSALWVDQNAETLADEAVEAITNGGVNDFFVPVGKLEPDGLEGVLTRLDPVKLPSQTTLTMVVEGMLPATVDTLGEQLAEAITQVRFDVEGRGLLPRGLHLDFRSVDSFESLILFLEELKGTMDEDLLLSLSIHRDWLIEPQLKAAVKNVDFIVPFLYGQRPNEREDSDAWDFGVIQDRLAEVEALEVPYVLGIVTLGTATHQDRRTNTNRRTTGQSLHPFLWERALKLSNAFSLEGANRRVYELTAQRPARVGGWDLAQGDVVRIIRPATTDINELLEIVDGGEYGRCRGYLFYRLPMTAEALSLGVEHIMGALGDEPVELAVSLDAQVQRRVRGGYLFRFLVTNENGEVSELSMVDNNFLQVQVVNGRFGDVKVGDFFRYGLFETKEDGSVEASFRRPDIIRLFVPVLSGRQVVASGDVMIRSSSPEMILTGQFLLPDGRVVQAGPYTWKGGELHDNKAEAAAESNGAEPTEGAAEAGS